MAKSARDSPASPDFPDTDRNWESSERAKRLRLAVKTAGGNQTVANRIGMPVGTLNRYMAGREMKASAMVSLAQASGVSLDWLATGRGAMRPGQPLASESPPPASKSPPPAPQSPDTSNLFGTLDIDRLARAMEKAFQMFAERDHRPSMRRLAQVVLLLYDDFVDPSQSSSAASGRLVHNEGDSNETD